MNLPVDLERLIRTTFCKISNITDDIAHGRIALPFGLGGQGLTNPQHIADSALVATWAGCAGFLSKTAPALQHIAAEVSVNNFHE